MIEAMLMGGVMGAQIKSIQHISHTTGKPSGTLYIDVPISIVDPAKSMLIPKSTPTGGGNYWAPAVYLINESNVRFEWYDLDRDADTNISVDIIEFSSGVFVQRGNAVNIAQYSNSAVVPLPDLVDSERTVVIVSEAADMNTSESSSRVAVENIHDNEFTVTRDSNSGSILVHWQAVEFK